MRSDRHALPAERGERRAGRMAEPVAAPARDQREAGRHGGSTKAARVEVRLPWCPTFRTSRAQIRPGPDLQHLFGGRADVPGQKRRAAVALEERTTD